MKNINIEVEGGEILIQSKEGHYAIIPAKHRREIEDMVKDNCENCINSYIQSLPKESDYAEDGTLIPGWDDIKEKVSSVFSSNKEERAAKKDPSINEAIRVRDNYQDNEELSNKKLDYTYEEVKDLSNNPEKLTASDKINLEGYAEEKETLSGDKSYYMIAPLKEVTITPSNEVFTDNLSSDDIKKEQKKLLEKGYYSDQLYNSTDDTEFYAGLDKDAIKKIQNNLNNKGYKLNNSIKKDGSFDGILGDETKQAIQNYNSNLYKKEVDGVVGEKSLAAEQNYNSFIENKKETDYNDVSTKILKDINTEFTSSSLVDPKDIVTSNINNPVSETITTTEQGKGEKFTFNNKEIIGDVNMCARYVSQTYKKYGIEGVSGDAWTYLKTLQNKNSFSKGYWLFNEKPKIEGDITNEKVSKAIESAIKNDEVNRKAILEASPLSGVNIYNKKSNYKTDAYTEGNTTIGTHAGIIIEKNGKKYVEHEIGGSTIFTPLEEMVSGEQGLYIIAVMENKNFSTKSYLKTNEIKYFDDAMKLEAKFGDLVGSVEGNTTYVKSIDYATQMQKSLGLNDKDVDNLAKATTLIIAQESAFNKSKVLDPSSTMQRLKDLASEQYIPVINPNSKEKSEGFAQFKVNTNLSPEMQKRQGINKESLSKLDQKGLNTSIKAVQIKLLNNFQSLANVNEENSLNVLDKDIWKLAIMGYNFDIEGIKKSLEKYKTFDNLIDAYKKEAGESGEEFAAYPPVSNFEDIKIKRNI